MNFIKAAFSSPPRERKRRLHRTVFSLLSVFTARRPFPGRRPPFARRPFQSLDCTMTSIPDENATVASSAVISLLSVSPQERLVRR